MAASMNLRYAVEFGKGDCGDWLDWEVDLTPDEELIYNKAIKDKEPLNGIDRLENALHRARLEIEKTEILTAIDNGDDYVLECVGKSEIDPDELNSLVWGRNEKALSYLGLTELPDEELERWDANDMEELPQIDEIRENFNVINPFDEGWNLLLVIVDPNEDENVG